MIAERLLCDRCHQSLSVFGRISRRAESDRATIAVINRLAFLAEFRGEMAVITSVFGRSSRRDWSDPCHRSQMVFGRISRCDHGPDEKDINEYFLSQKKSSELKFVLKFA